MLLVWMFDLSSDKLETLQNHLVRQNKCMYTHSVATACGGFVAISIPNIRLQEHLDRLCWERLEIVIQNFQCAQGYSSQLVCLCVCLPFWSQQPLEHFNFTLNNV